jgi:hypothetical protein
MRHGKQSQFAADFPDRMVSRFSSSAGDLALFPIRPFQQAPAALRPEPDLSPGPA